jgi:Tfp pilus assembly protein PilF
MFDKLKKYTCCWPYLTIILFGILAYANTFDVPFYLDDYSNIRENRAIQINRLAFQNIIDAGLRSPLAKRPVANISFALNYYLGGFEVFGYHLVNIIIHVTTGVLLFLFFRLTLETPAALRMKYQHGYLIAFCGALLWLVHPAQTQSVTYIVQRMNSFASMFYILAFWFYVKGRFSGTTKSSVPYYLGVVLSWLLAMGCKEIAVTLPFLIFFYEWIFFQDGEVQWLRKKIPYVMVLFMVLAILAFAYLGGEPWNNILRGYDFREFTLNERVLTQFRVVFFYISLLLLPVPNRYGLEHDISLSASLLQPVSTVVALVAIMLVLIYAFAVVRRQPIVAFSIIWFLGNLVIESSVIPLEIVFEHRLYLPSMFFFLPLCTLAFRYRSKQNISLAVLVCCSMVFGAATYARNSDWKDPVHFWQKNITIAPESERLHSNLGRALWLQDRPSEALKHLHEAIRINPFYPQAYINLGVANLRLNRFQDAVMYFKKALSYDSNIFEGHLSLGSIYTEMGNYKEGLAHLKEAVRIKPASAAAQNNFANLLLLLGRYGEALLHYDKALELDPNFEDAKYNRQIALKRLMQGK